jgi:hypothetical protein
MNVLLDTNKDVNITTKYFPNFFTNDVDPLFVKTCNNIK